MILNIKLHIQYNILLFKKIDRYVYNRKMTKKKYTTILMIKGWC